MFQLLWCLVELMSLVHTCTLSTLMDQLTPYLLLQWALVRLLQWPSLNRDTRRGQTKTQKQKATTGLRSCNNILAMTQSLHSKLPVYIGDQKINLSWKEAPKPSVPTNAAVTDQKRVAAASTAGNGSSTNANKKGRGADGTREDLASYLFP